MIDFLLTLTDLGRRLWWPSLWRELDHQKARCILAQADARDARWQLRQEIAAHMGTKRRLDAERSVSHEPHGVALYPGTTADRRTDRTPEQPAPTRNDQRTSQ